MQEGQHWNSLPPRKAATKVQNFLTDVSGKNSSLQFRSEALQ